MQQNHFNKNILFLVIFIFNNLEDLNILFDLTQIINNIL